MINQLPIIVYDLETDSQFPEKANLWEISALVIDPRTLEIKEGETFSSLVQPPGITDWVQYEKDSQGARNVNKIPIEDIKNAPGEAQVFKNFVEFVKRYSLGNHITKAPIFAGFNIINYDNKIMDRLCFKYKVVKNDEPALMNRRDRIDLMNWLFLFYENAPEPQKYNLGEVRRFLGLSEEGAHRSLKDTEDVAKIICRKMKFMRRIMQKYGHKMKSSF